ncbi:MAG: dihydrofolate reductase [Chromatiales bacterium]|nr:dihydrofolate reductase [Chromatiales bacterium]
MVIALIVAMDDNRLIGASNRLPWRIPADLTHFRKITMGKPILMGRKTFESIGKPLAGRRNIVISRNHSLRIPGAEVAHGLDEAIALVSEQDEVMVIGGAELYRQALPLAQRLYITRIHGEFEGDTWFPEIPTDLWRLADKKEHGADPRNPCRYGFYRYERVGSGG